ncbi:Prenylcysteine lyase-domain-containing protein [Dipodascopsis uninucleata]
MNRYSNLCIATVLSIIAVVAVADHVPFQIPIYPASSSSLEREKIAIIGAGSGGSSTAYYLQKYSNYSYDITVFDKNSYIGGRCTTVYVHDDRSWPVELGASIFVKENYNLVQASKEFGLRIRKVASDRVNKKDGENIDELIGIWDGSQFVFQSSTSSWRSVAKMFYQYGTAPFHAKRTGSDAIKKFLNYYSAKYFPFSNLTQISEDLELTEFSNSTAYKLFQSRKVRKEFITEILQAATRVNYGQNIMNINALGAAVCIAAEGGMSIEGGNWQIFASMLERSNAELHLNTEVTQIEKSTNGMWEVFTKSEVKEFDQVVIAAPIIQTGITGMEGLDIPEVKYITIHVTLLATNKRLSSKYFGLLEDMPIPNVLLTTLPQGSNRMPPLFNSISIVRYIPERKEYVYKIFSPTKIQDGFLDLMFDKNGNITWKYEKIWYAYPRLDRIDQFTPFKTKLEGIWYLNGMEQFISTMETSSLAGANVAALIVGKQNKTIISVP